MRYFYIEQSDLHTEKPVIRGTDAKHIKQVLRLKPGNIIGLFDGQGYEYKARIIAMYPKGIEISILNRSPALTESPVRITVAQAVLKERKMDGLIRQLTELGTSEWIPFIAKRSVPKSNMEHLSGRTDRWKKIVREALKQSRRGQLTKIGNLLSFHELLTYEKNFDLKITFWEEESTSIQSACSGLDRYVQTILVMIGPEGGFTREEVEDAKSSGFVVAGLGPRILRAETATIAACSILQYLFGDMGQSK